MQLTCPFLNKDKTNRVLQHKAMKTYGGIKVKLHIFFTSALDGNFTPRKEPTVPNW